MCAVCTEAVHCVALWTRVTLRCGHVCSMYRGSPLPGTFNTGYMKVRTCVQYVPTANVPCARLESKVRHNMMKKVNNKIAVSLRSSTANVGLCGYIYLHLVDLFGFHVGKYTGPMDFMGNEWIFFGKGNSGLKWQLSDVLFVPASH